MSQAMNSTFEKHGHTWIPHKAGDPMPCHGSVKVFVLLSNGMDSQTPMKAGQWMWGKCSVAEVTGWRYEEKQIQA